MNNNNNIVCYKKKGTKEFITNEEYGELIKKAFNPFNSKNFKKLEMYQPITENDGYYIFFKEEIKKKLERQIKMEI